ncbi:Phosphoesterase [Alkalibacterium sp. AK22]|uniref:TIGR00282 family metallophosphoesterase n=1 Tax=Alkalibacterium sp. AK22 TaxID=1229520 RepID=UPI0004458020|nr:TIGR00282 family metallophosphoesterase [Alkalibacterium sp. AK22]EXJ22332.1 Phosphoesterase [Alkalibacterium sp. AK22]
MKVLFIGDIVGELGVDTVKKWLPKLKEKYKPQVTVANGENAAGGRGITEKLYKELLQAGVDVVTMGNHTWDQREIQDFIDREKKLIRPANYPDNRVTPGTGMTIVNVNQLKLAVINLHGRVYMGDFEDPFRVAQELVDQAREVTPHILIDFHAEATSEKEALGWYLDGQVSAVVGTHTHVQTNDARVLPQGTAYQTDVGMTGFYDGVLGMKKEPILRKFTTQLPNRFEVPETGRTRLNACLLTISNTTGRADKIQAIRIDDDMPWFE